jgi:cytochrome c oxidase subunit 7a
MEYFRSGEEIEKGYEKVKPVQARLGAEDGTPIYIKGGVLDTLLYRLTMACCIGGVAWDCKLYFDLSLL